MYKKSTHTDGKKFYPSILQALRRGNHIILGLPIRDQYSNLGNARPGPRLWFEAVFQDEGQSQTYRKHEDRRCKIKGEKNESVGLLP